MSFVQHYFLLSQSEKQRGDYDQLGSVDSRPLPGEFFCGWSLQR
jgi:hypothetical protein